MKQPLRVFLALTHRNNDYQVAQVRAAEEAAKAQNASIEVSFCDGDAVEQSQQILKCVLSHSKESGIAGIIVQPVGTGLYQVAQAAAAAGMGWVLLHREVDYIPELRAKHRGPIFALMSDHKEEGAIQAKQLAALLPNGGKILYLAGPTTDSVAQQRSMGMGESKPENIQLSTIRGNWTVDGAERAVATWWKLPTSRQQTVVAVAAQNDAMAFGARKALKELPDVRLSNIPVIGCDGLPQSGQDWVQKRILNATTIVPVLAGLAVDLLLQAITEKKVIPENTVIAPKSYPDLGKLIDTRS
jgi:ABC-type sugar transport system substrate-binding protein